MAIDALGAIGSPTETTPRNATVNQNDFLKILLTQLKFQDPMKPVDNQQFLAQLPPDAHGFRPALRRLTFQDVER